MPALQCVRTCDGLLLALGVESKLYLARQAAMLTQICAQIEWPGN